MTEKRYSSIMTEKRSTYKRKMENANGANTANASSESSSSSAVRDAKSFAVGDFSIGRVVGSGKYGTVYQAKHTASGKVRFPSRKLWCQCLYRPPL